MSSVPDGIAGFEYAGVNVGSTSYRSGVAGDGSAILLLNRFLAGSA